MNKAFSEGDNNADGRDSDPEDGAQQANSEEIEEVLLKLPGKLFQFNEDNSTWVTLATGEVSVTHSYTQNGTKINFLTRRDTDLKIYANHWISSDMKLQPTFRSNRSWLWTAFEDLSEPIPTKRVFAVRFASAENALKFKKVFDEAPKKDSSSITNHVEVKSQLDLLRLERERIDRQITMLEQRGGDGAR